jgi:two-component system, OmpR family, sensor histidine kinase TctE
MSHGPQTGEARVSLTERTSTAATRGSGGLFASGGFASSIRRRLLILLLPSLLALMLAGVFVNYHAAMLIVSAAYDHRLGDAARGLAARVVVAGPGGAPRIDLSPATGAESSALRLGILMYSIRDSRGTLLAGDSRLMPARAGASNPSFADASFQGQDFRLATYRLPIGRDVAAISVAEPAALRAGAGHFILASTWLMDFIQVDVTLLLVWIAVHFGLKPLLALRRQIETRSARELQPLAVSHVPSEVRPLVDTLNLLFEMLDEAARAQRQFVADTAHQLRTPIAGLMGHLELLMRDQAAAPPVRERLAQLHDAMGRLAHSANQLLALARADPSAGATDGFEGVELERLVGRVVALNVDRALESGHDLGAETAPATIRGNPRLLEDLLANLVDNALTYTPAAGHVTVRSGVTRGKAFLEVEDDGPGIAKSERARVRQRFYRIPGTTGRGCGLGLAIVDEIARAHDATVLIDAGAGERGTRIRVEFPPGAAAERPEPPPGSARAQTANGVAI